MQLIARQNLVQPVAQREPPEAELASSRWNRRELMLLGGLLAAAFVVYVFNFQVMQIGTYQDDAHYVVTARALVASQGFTLASLANASPELHFPPGYPLLLTPVVLLAPRALDALRVPSILFTLASIPLWFVYLRRRLSVRWTFLILAAGAVNPLIVSHATMVMSEAAFLLLVALLAVVSDQVASRAPLSAVVVAELAALVTALYFVRTIGIAFVAGTLLFLLLRRQIRAAVAVGIAFAVPFLAWFYRNAQAAGTFEVSSYQVQFVQGDSDQQGAPSLDLFSRVMHNASDYATNGLPNVWALDPPTHRLTSLLATLHLAWAPAFIGVACTALILVGFGQRLLTEPGVVEWSVLFYVGILLIWPWSVPRYLHPLVFLAYFYLIESLNALFAKLARQVIPSHGEESLGRIRPRDSSPWLGMTWWVNLVSAPLNLARAIVAGLSSKGVGSQRAVVGVMAALIVLSLARDVEEVRFPVRDRTTNISVGAPWIVANTPRDAIVMSSAALERSLYTNRPMVEIPPRPAPSPAAYLAEIDQTRASYVIVAPPLQSHHVTTLDPANAGLEAAMKANPGRFTVVYDDESNNVRIYDVLR